jgi:hypothetical protein
LEVTFDNGCHSREEEGNTYSKRKKKKRSTYTSIPKDLLDTTFVEKTYNT